jgi:hypothetical protein
MSRFQLKQIQPDAVPAALRKAEHYRLLKEPRQAESICHDILEIEPGHRQALITLVLALTDQFGTDTDRKSAEARKLVATITDEYERTYYSGLVCERRATAHLESLLPGTKGWAYDWYRQAMEFYELAEKKQPPGNNDALLRWNTCARTIMQYGLEPVQEPVIEPPLE